MNSDIKIMNQFTKKNLAVMRLDEGGFVGFIGCGRGHHIKNLDGFKH